MKIHLFYIIKNNIDLNKYHAVYLEKLQEIGDLTVALYAFTPEKYVAKDFKKLRKKKLFFEKVVDMEREEYEEFCDDNEDALIEYHAFNTKKLESDGKYHCREVVMLATRAEYDSILFYKEEYVLRVLSETLDDKTMEFIDKHHFKKKLENIMNEYFIYDSVVNRIAPLEDLNMDEFIVDDLALYIKLFSNTFKKKRWGVL